MSTPTSTSSRKRKADALESADDGVSSSSSSSSSSSGRKLKVAATAATTSAHLPASCLAAILNFMEYAEVRRCLLAGKVMAVDAARHVKTLNIMNASELVPSAARRFANVTEINILSLVTTNEDGDEDILSADTATRSVPFLMAFPKANLAFLGGIWRNDNEEWSKIFYSKTTCIEPEDHLSVFRGLADHLCGAFRSRSLSPCLHLEGIAEQNKVQVACNENERKDDHRCRRCWAMVTSFPPEFVLKKIPEHFGRGFCLPHSECIDALASRHDNPLRFHPQAAIKYFLATTKGMIRRSKYRYTGRDIDNSFIERIASEGGKIGKVDTASSVTFYFMTVKDMELLKRISAAIGPSVINSIPKDELLSAVSWLCEDTKDGKKPVLARQTFESLVQLGFGLASKDFVLIDPLTEDALTTYRPLFRSEGEAS